MSGPRCNPSMRRVRQIGIMMAMLYRPGYVLQVAGWHLRENDGHHAASLEHADG